jgi:CRP-like cAMP-binding protein
MPQDAPNSDFQTQIRKLRDCLQSVDFLYQLKVDELDHLMGALKKRRCTANYTVIKQGDPGDAFYMISSGKVEVTAGGKVIATRGPGEFFGEGALLHDSPRGATVRTVEETELYVLYKADFNKILMANPGIAASIKTQAAMRKTPPR